MTLSIISLLLILSSFLRVFPSLDGVFYFSLYRVSPTPIRCYPFAKDVGFGARLQQTPAVLMAAEVCFLDFSFLSNKLFSTLDFSSSLDAGCACNGSMM